MDGLLLDTERIGWQTFQDLCRELELPNVDHVFYACVGRNANASNEVLKDGLEGLTCPVEFREKWDAAYTALTHERPLPHKDGVTEILDALKAMDIPVAVATSTKTPRAKSKLLHSGLLDYFPVVIGGDQVEHSKPAPDIYLRAATAINADPAKCLAFEDSTNGVRAAVAAGMTVVQIPDLVEPPEELRQLGHIILESLAHAREYDFGGH